MVYKGLRDFICRPYVSHCLSVFGTRRCMFGSDWPVCKLAGAEHSQVGGAVIGHHIAV